MFGYYLLFFLVLDTLVLDPMAPLGTWDLQPSSFIMGMGLYCHPMMLWEMY